MNLIGNSLKYTFKGKIGIEVKWTPNEDSIPKEFLGKSKQKILSSKHNRHLMRYSTEWERKSYSLRMIEDQDWGLDEDELDSELEFMSES